MIQTCSHSRQFDLWSASSLVVYHNIKIVNKQMRIVGFETFDNQMFISETGTQ